MLELLKILEKDPEFSFNKDQSFCKLDWAFNEKCIELLKDFMPYTEIKESNMNSIPKKRTSLTRKKSKIPLLKTITEEESIKTLKKLKVCEKIKFFQEKEFVFKNSFSKFSNKSEKNTKSFKDRNLLDIKD